MTGQELPGQPVHIRIAGDHVMVMFDLVPWKFRCDDLNGAVSAFANNDWRFFQREWWARHQYLSKKSEKLALLSSHLSDCDLFNANRIIALGSFLGFYGLWDMAQMDQDAHRLALMPIILGWPQEGFGHVDMDGQSPAIAWPGEMWRSALESGSGVSGLSPDFSLSQPIVPEHFLLG